MKQYLTLFVLICSYMLCGAQATSLTVDNQTPGWLSNKINYGDQQTIKNLTVTGYINQADLSFIGDLMSKHSLSGHLDLTDAELVDTKFSDSPTSIGGTLTMFQLSQKVSINRFSIPKSIPKVSPYLLAQVQADTLDYGSERCPVLTKLLVTNAYFGTTICPKVLILRDGLTKIDALGTDEGNEKKLQTVFFSQTVDSIGDNAFKNCSNLVNINLPDNIHTIGEMAFAETSVCPDSLHLPTSLKTYYTNSFPIKNGQVIVLGNKVNNFNNRSWYLKKTTNVTYIINKVTPPTFTKGKNDSNSIYSDGQELSGCTLYVPKEGFSMYADPNYNSVNSFWSGWSNPYSHAKLKTIYIPVEEVLINNTSTTLNVGGNINLVANVVPSNADNTSISWVSSNPNVSSVNSFGLVTAISSGFATIFAYSSENSDIYATCDVTVHQPLESLALNSKKITLNAGQTYDGLLLKYYPATADNKNVTWQSSNAEILTVDDTGKINAIKGGEAKVIVISTENCNIKDECTVTVLQPTTGISLNKSDLEIIEDESIHLIASVVPDDASNKNVNWTSSDVSVAMVSPDGTVYALKPGQATIMATTVDGGFVALCKISVKPKKVTATAIRLSRTEGTIAIGETLQLNATIEPENVTNKTIRWTSTNPNIATVNADGIVQALAEGSTQIIATTTDESNLSAICNVTVEKQFISITHVQIEPSNARIAIGKTLKLKALITPDNATSTDVLWSSTNTSVATVSADGEVEAISEGNAVIIASTPDGSNLSATCTITVYNDIIFVTEIILDPTEIEGIENETATIKALVIPENATNKQLRWYSSNDNIAVVNDGIIELKHHGTAIITAEALDGSNVKSECTVVVSDSVGIDSIIKDKDTYVTIFDTNGHLIHQGNYDEARLEPGIYIVLYNGKSFKAKFD